MILKKMCPPPGISFSLITSRLLTIIQIFTSGRKQRGSKKPLDDGERGEWKSWLKLSIQKSKIMAFGPITSWQIDEETMETVTDFTFLDSKIIVDSDCSHELKDAFSLEEKLLQT